MVPACPKKRHLNASSHADEVYVPGARGLCGSGRVEEIGRTWDTDPSAGIPGKVVVLVGVHTVRRWMTCEHSANWT